MVPIKFAVCTTISPYAIDFELEYLVIILVYIYFTGFFEVCIHQQQYVKNATNIRALICHRVIVMCCCMPAFSLGTYFRTGAYKWEVVLHRQHGCLYSIANMLQGLRLCVSSDDVVRF